MAGSNRGLKKRGAFCFFFFLLDSSWRGRKGASKGGEQAAEAVPVTRRRGRFTGGREGVNSSLVRSNFLNKDYKSCKVTIESILPLKYAPEC